MLLDGLQQMADTGLTAAVCCIAVHVVKSESTLSLHCSYMLAM